MEAATLRARGGIDRARMQIRVEGKGAKERVLPMSAHLLHVVFPRKSGHGERS
jgi:site-specific recombinase XerD